MATFSTWTRRVRNSGVGSRPCPINLEAAFAWGNYRSLMSSIYLDHAATTPVRDEVVAAMTPYLTARFGNPSSIHRWGQEAAAALEEARDRLASAIGARASEVRFVRGGTESDNLAIIGGVRALARAGDCPVLMASAIEHSAVLQPSQWLAARGEAEFRRVPVSPEGRLDFDAVSGDLDRRPSLLSVMWANNETGVLLPVDEAVAWAAHSGTVVHTDASQALGKVAIDLEGLGIHLLTATGHKIGGPRGTGLLFVRDGVEIEPLMFGGGQERTLRPGTEDVAGAIGLTEAICLAVQELDRCPRHLTAMRDRLEARLVRAIPHLRVNCEEARRVPHILSLGVPDITNPAAFLMALDLEGIAASSGSACQSGAASKSHVISALYGPNDPFTTVRFSVGPSTTEDQVEQAATLIERVWKRLSLT